MHSSVFVFVFYLFFLLCRIELLDAMTTTNLRPAIFGKATAAIS